MEAQNQTIGTQELTNLQKMLVTADNNPTLYIEITKNSIEKQELVAILRKFVVIEENETRTGISGTYKVNGEFITIHGAEVTTGLSKSTRRKKYVGMDGYKKWYGGSELYNETDKTEYINIFDNNKIYELKERLMKKAA